MITHICLFSDQSSTTEPTDDSFLPIPHEMTSSAAPQKGTVRLEAFAPLDTAGRSSGSLPPAFLPNPPNKKDPYASGPVVQRAEHVIKPYPDHHLSFAEVPNPAITMSVNHNGASSVPAKSEYTMSDVFETVAQLCRQLDQLGLRVTTDIQQLQAHQDHEKQV